MSHVSLDHKNIDYLDGCECGHRYLNFCSKQIEKYMEFWMECRCGRKSASIRCMMDDWEILNYLSYLKKVAKLWNKKQKKGGE